MPPFVLDVEKNGHRCCGGRRIRTDIFLLLCWFLVVTQNQIGRFLGGTGCSHDYSSIALDCLHPALDVGGLVLDDVIVDSAFGTKEGRCHLGDQLFFAIRRIAKTPGHVPIKAGA